jgi:hypothetical protein
MERNLLLETLIEKPREASYYEAVGRLITSYAAAEGVAHILARKYSGLSDDVARIIFGGMRYADLKERLKKLVNRYGSEFAKTELGLVLQQLGVISTARDKIAHRLTSYSGEVGLTVTNQALAKSLEAIQTDVFTVEQLRAMKDDCDMILFRLLVLMRPELEESFRKGDPRLYEPWRHKPPVPARKKAGKRGAPR